MNPEQVTEFANELFEIYNDDEKTFYNLEILSIDNVYCDVYLNINLTNIILHISSLITDNTFFEKILVYKKEKLQLCDIIEAIHKLYEILPKIKFNKKKNELTTMKTTTDISSILCHSNIQTKMDNCSVCLDMTTGKTKCKHSLCLLCNSKLQYNLQNEMNENDDECVIPCPICRKDIL